MPETRQLDENQRLPWRAIFWIGFYGAVLAAWALLFLMTRSPMPGISAAEYWASLCIPANEADAFSVFGMWALMSAAMMLPTFVPAARVFGDIGGIGASDARSQAALVAGYGVGWLSFSAAATIGQLGLAQLGAFTVEESGLAPLASALLLAAAGAYQFSLVKAACLAKCRHPLMFFMERWQPGVGPAFVMGLRLSAYCVGCCWVLMLLGFVGGAMNLLWMGAATLFMVIEKLPTVGGYLTRPAGAALLLAAALMAAQTLEII